MIVLGIKRGLLASSESLEDPKKPTSKDIKECTHYSNRAKSKGDCLIYSTNLLMLWMVLLLHVN